MRQKFKEIVVTVEMTYLVPLAEGSHTEINGWTIEEVGKDWFERHNINSSHATRDGYRLGGADRVLDWRVQSPHPKGNNT